MPSESVATELHGMRYEALRYRGDKIYGIGFGRPFEGETCMDKEPSWETPRRAHFTHEEDVAFLRRANIGRVVFAMTERDLLAMTGSSEQNPTMDTPARSIFASSQKDIEVIGPFPELIEEATAFHTGYWGK